MRKIFAFFLAILIACNGAISWNEPKITINQNTVTTATICLDLPEKQIIAANQAVKEWDYVLRAWRRLTAIILKENDKAYCTYVIREDEPVESSPIAEASMLGGREIILYRGRYEHHTKDIIMHELGHCFGAQHVDGTLMNLHWDDSINYCPDRTTVAQVAAYNQINLDLLAWCSP